MDKIDLFIVAFIVMFIVTAGLLVTGTVPVIFNTGIAVNETKYESKNQTHIILDFIATTLDRQDKILNMNQNISNQILNMSQEHKQITTKMDNITQLSYNLLAKHTVNSSLAEGKAEEAVNKSGR